MQDLQVSLIFDATEVERQIKELSELIQARFPNGIPDQFLRHFTGISLDVVFSNHSSTLMADGTIELLQGFRLGSCFENLRATIIASKFRESHK